MNKLSKSLIATLLVGSVVTPVFAEQRQASESLAFEAADYDALFDSQSEVVEVAALSNKEMTETNGSFFNPYGAAIGAAAGGAGYAYRTVIGGSRWSWYSFGSSAGAGFVAGSGAGAVTAIWGANAYIGTSLFGGVMDYNGW